MSGLDRKQRDLIFDSCLGLSSTSETAQVVQLIASDQQAAAMHSSIQSALAPLASVPPEVCPEELAERTVRRLCDLAGHNAVSAAPSPSMIKLGLTRNLSNAAAVVVVAVSILLLLGVLVPSSNLMRHRYHKQMCRAQLGSIFKSMDIYSADHDDVFPATARADGAAWNRIGRQGPEDCSNTRGLYLLLRLNYHDRPMDFVCCGRAQDDTPRLQRSQINTYCDFPSREHITYSYRILSSPTVKKVSLAARPVMADMNPHFERMGAERAAAFTLRLEEDSLSLNSLNHDRRGQNVLYGGGYVGYSTTRIVGDPPDDMYTIRDQDVCHGYELPCSLTDTLLAP